MFDPGSPRDGVTVHVPLKVLPQLKAAGFDWLVPALRLELVTALIRSLPKELRRALVPVPETAQGAARPRHAAQRPAARRARPRAGGDPRRARARAAPGRSTALPAHLRMTFRVEDDEGRLVAEGTDLAALRDAVRPKLRAALSAAAAPLEAPRADGLDDRRAAATVALPGTGQAVRGYPALVDEGATAGVRVLDSAARRRRRRWPRAPASSSRSNVPSPLRHAQKQLGQPRAAHARGRAARRRARGARRLRRRGARRADRAGRRPGLGRGRVPAAARPRRRRARRDDGAGRSRASSRSSTPRASSSGRSTALSAPQLQFARDDVREQLARLVHPGFVAEAGARRLADVERYLAAASRRLERLPAAPAPDRDRMNGVRELEALWAARGRPDGGALAARGAAREPLRAGARRARAVSAKKIRQLLQG